MSGSSLISSMVDETANLGKIQTSISFIVSIVIGVLLIISAIYMGFQSPKPSVKALIQTSKCDTVIKNVNDKKEVYYTCLLNLKYTINNIDYINDLSVSSSTVYNPNTYIDIEYEETNPNMINLKGLDNSTISSISVCIAIIIIIFSFINYYLSTQSKTYAALQGVSTIGNFFSSK
jgi:hypothetical protein